MNSRRVAIATSVFLILWVLPCSLAQQSPAASKPTRDSQAIAMLQAALIAFGGDANLGTLRDAQATGTRTVNGTSEPFTWKNSGAEFRYEYPNAAPYEASILVSGHGAPAAVVNSKTIKLAPGVAWAHFPAYLPAWMLHERFGGTNFSLSYQGAAVVAGKPVFRVQVNREDNKFMHSVSQQTWSFDAATGVPVEIEFAAPDANNIGSTETVTAILSKYQSVSGVLVPFQITYTYPDGTAEIFEIASVAFNVGLPSSTFDAPTGGAQ
jgi:hypothetical protein